MLKSDSDIDEIRQELAVLQVKYEALLHSHQELALKVLGDTPETAVFLENIQEEIGENWPEFAK